MPERTKVDAMGTVDTAPGVEPLTKAAERGRVPEFCRRADQGRDKKMEIQLLPRTRLFGYIMRWIGKRSVPAPTSS